MKAILEFQGFTKMIEIPRPEHVWRVPLKRPLEWNDGSDLGPRPSDQGVMIEFTLMKEIVVLGEAVLLYDGRLL